MISLLMQWLAFLLIVAGTYVYASSFRLGASAVAAGCVAMTAWCWLQHPVPYGVFGVQVVVGLLSVRNAIVGPPGDRP